jgi:hypothetical protein
MKNAQHPSSSTAAPKEKGKKLSWWKRTLLCMNIEIHKENYSAYRERTTILYNQRVLSRELRSIKSPDEPLSPPPLSCTYVEYNNWNAETLNWNELEEVAKGKEVVDDDDVPSAASTESSDDDDYADDDDEETSE